MAGMANPQTLPSDETLIDEAVARALALLQRSEELATRTDRNRSKSLSAILASDDSRDLVLDLTDQVLRIRQPKRAAQRLRELVAAGVPSGLSAFDRFGLSVLGKAAPLAPSVAGSLVDWRIDKDTAGVILAAEDPAFAKYLRIRRGQGYKLNVNILGEAILGNDEADERMRRVLAVIARPDVDYISVKISALCANLDILAEEHSIERIKTNLRTLYRAANAASPVTFINLDMEEFRDLELSVRSFMEVLDEPEFMSTRAGIVLQAYIPDSNGVLDRVSDWAVDRVRGGGVGIKIRLVKGANLAMEQVEAELHDWRQAPYFSKTEVDASFKRMLETALACPEPAALSIGVASHNLFEIAWALTVADHLDARNRLELEMLEGMAPPQAAAVLEAAGSLLLYAPIVAASERDASIAYLSRRLDENSAPENFLRSLFDITPGSPAWELERRRFIESVTLRHTVATASHRDQDQSKTPAPFPRDHFENSAETDFTSRPNREWIHEHLAKADATEPTLVTTIDEVNALVARGIGAQPAWRALGWDKRRELILDVADAMEAARGETLALMAASTGKTMAEGDPEISEAIDFARYAAQLASGAAEREAAGLTWQPHQLVVVAGPWNFPYAIPASGVVHALVAGSSVILKPAPEARAVGALLVKHLHSAGVPTDVLQLACTPDDETGKRLITHPDADLVMLTGSIDTANLFLDWRPDLHLHAETSGKNAIVITQAADIDQAIKDLVKSAFGHAGQKCSAASLAIVEAPIYDDPSFGRRLADAVRSLRVGWATDLSTMVGPCIVAPRGNLERAVSTLEPGERWLVEPQYLSEDKRVVFPGVRWDVQPGSWFHRTECFGPVLGIMRARNLAHALELQNATEYGLTAGIESLDPAEIETWIEGVHAGNIYINRQITGAIVQRQPFGGWKRSSVGPTHKPGGPNHLLGYGTWTDPRTGVDVRTAYTKAWREHFSRDNDPSKLNCESNVLRYRPLGQMLVVGGTAPDLERLQVASELTGVPMRGVGVDSLESEIAGALDPDRTRIRALTPLDPTIRRAAHDRGIIIDDAPVTADGYVELPRWLLEQAVARSMHRYGRLLRRN